MAKRAYIGIGGVARTVKKGYVGVYTVPKKQYALLDYIASTGTQYIDTDFYARGDTKVVLDCDITYGSGWCMILGSYDSNAYFSWWASDGHIDPYYASSSKQTTAPSGRTTLIADGNNWTANGTTMTFSASTFTAPSTIYIFSVHNGGNYSNASMKLYACQIYDNGTMKRDYVPAKRVSDGAVGLYDKVEKKFYENAGTGAFTAGAETGEYIYDIPQAGEFARRIKKAYVGVGGVARPCWSGGELAYFGAVTPMSVGATPTATATNGNHALLVGSTALDAYDRELTQTHPEFLRTTDTWNGASEYNGAYFLVASGMSGSDVKTVTAYNDELTRFSAPDLSSARRPTHGSAAVGEYAFFAGGSNYTTSVDAYDRDLTRTNPTGLTTGVYFPAGIATENHALIAGGQISNGSRVTTVNVYDRALTKSTAAALSVARDSPGFAASEMLAMICGGDDTNSSVCAAVDTYTDDLVHSTGTGLSVARRCAAGVFLGEWFLLCGGENTSGTLYATTDIYDNNLVRTTGDAISIARSTMEGTTVGDYALIPGGYAKSDDGVKAVDAFTIH